MVTFTSSTRENSFNWTGCWGSQ